MNDLHCRRLFVMSLSFLNVSPIDSTCMSLFILSTHRRLGFVSLSFRILYEVHRVEFGELSFYIFYLCRPVYNAPMHSRMHVYNMHVRVIVESSRFEYCPKDL